MPLICLWLTVFLCLCLCLCLCLSLSLSFSLSLSLSVSLSLSLSLSFSRSRCIAPLNFVFPFCKEEEEEAGPPARTELANHSLVYVLVSWASLPGKVSTSLVFDAIPEETCAIHNEIFFKAAMCSW